MINIWYDIIKDGEILTTELNKDEAIKKAVKLDAEYVMLVVDFEPTELVWDREGELT